MVGGVTNIRRNVTGLTDPFGTIAMPTGSTTPRTYPATCPTATAAVYKATTTPVVHTSYVYVTANNGNQAVSNAQAGTNTYEYSSPLSASTTPGTVTHNVNVFSHNTNGTSTDSGTSYTSMRRVIDDPKVFEVRKRFTRTTYSNFTETPGTSGAVTLEPGAYTSINIACTTNFNPGIYRISGSIDFSQNHIINGNGVMFVMENANSISNINSNTEITISGISASMLQSTYGYSASDAAKLAGMIMWDALSDSQIKWNGNSVSILNGTLYMPNRPLWFNGTAAVSGRCMMLVGRTLMFTGTIDLSSFCQTSGSSIFTSKPQTVTTTTTAATAASVRLVA